jgi:homogentisate 1,2-dioxygenase
MVEVTDDTDPAGEPLTLVHGDGVAVSLSHRSAPMPFVEKNIDAHQIRFYHAGEFTLQTELGALDLVPGDFVVIPKGMFYRETPKAADGNAVVIFESRSAIVPAEELWDGVGFTSFFVDYSKGKIPTPQPIENDPAEEVVARVKFKGAYHEVVYDFDPCHDVAGWLGDPVIYALNVWDVPGLGSSHGFLPPPAAAVLYARDKSFFFNVMTPKPFPTTPAPDGSYGAPAHMNDYDEIWFNHRAEHAPDTDGHLWRLPPTLPHPGLKRPPEYPDNPPRHIHEVKLNFDTRAVLEWTDGARAAFLEDPKTSIYTSMMGTHIGVVPEDSLKFVKR